MWEQAATMLATRRTLSGEDRNAVMQKLEQANLTTVQT
jgi:hypothetical protein